jgi:NDP-hexose C3-ketoreductase / dTDP-4-oxo-2-deoxy-alpha-D-pentos-2-ene 2,3-reductase
VLVPGTGMLYVGSSNFAGWHIATANQIATRRSFLGLVSEQSLYHLAERSIELEVIPACLEYGLGVLPWSPLAGGALGGVLEKLEGGRRVSEWTQQSVSKLRPQIERYEALCREIGEPPAVVALAWLLTRPAVTAPIIGPRTMEQLEDALHALTVNLDGDQLNALEEIWPGPGSAPEAYAW